MPDYDSRQADPFPYPTAAEVEATPGDPATKAARNIAVRQFGGIPRRGYLLGDCDHSPMMKGIIDFTGAVGALLEEIDKQVGEDGGGPLDTAARRVRDMMEDHGCQ